MAVVRRENDAQDSGCWEHRLHYRVVDAGQERPTMSLTMGTAPFGHQPWGISNAPLPGKGWLYLEPSPRRIRGIVGDQVVVDCRAPMLFFEHGQLPRYYFPRESVRTDLLMPNGRTETAQGKGTARYVDLALGDRVVDNAGWTYESDGGLVPDLRPYVAFYWRSMDRWLEEDMEALAHARDPYHRVDAVPSSRRVRVSVDGEVLAESERTVVIFETALPPRWYFPPDDVRAGLEPSDLRTTCAYKGHASYWSVQVGDGFRANLAWTYEQPRRDAEPVRDMVCFFNEQVDLQLDDEAAERPVSPWSEADWWRGRAIDFENRL
jgi:uncharacterized protein (DUF427 family)